MAVRLLVLASVLVACGGSYSGNTRPQTPGKAGKGGIERAALPYSVLDARTGRQVDLATFWNQVASSRVVCVGEEHNNPHHHWFQLETVKQLVALNKTKKPLALGMEMFQRPFQGVLDDYAARRIDDSALRSRAGYEERWGYEYGFYGPTIDLARDAGAKLLALNAPKELTKAVVRKGVDGLDPDEKKQLPELVLDDQVHRTWFEGIMEDMGGGHGNNPHEKKKEADAAAPADGEAPAPSAPAESAPAMPSMDRIYTAQVVWDETMADGAASWANSTPTGSLVLLAGNGHCHDSAIVGRVRRRGVDKAISLRPVIDTEGRVSSELAKPQTDFLIVLEMPKQ